MGPVNAIKSTIKCGKDFRSRTLATQATDHIHDSVFDIQVTQELWRILCVSITLTWRSQCVNCSRLWTLLIIFIPLQKIVPIKEMFLMSWVISFSLICLRVICMYYAAFFMTGLNTKWTWYFQMCSSVCPQVRNCEKWYCGVGSVFLPLPWR